jgi:perosamine synthetase
MKIQKNSIKIQDRRIIPVNSPVITLEDAKSIFRAAKTGWVSSAGKQIEDFENSFSKFIGLKYATTVSSGTAALEIAIKALGIKKGDEVIIPNFTIISNALCVIRQGATPVYVDCNKFNWNMKIEDIEKKINRRTKAIIATHIYNYPIDIYKIKKIAASHKVALIEDAAEVLGHKFKRQYCGSFGDISIFSFYANKHITTGEGGMILSNNKLLIDKCKSLKNLCFGKIDRFAHDDIGWNYRMTNLQAALGCSQLKRIRDIIIIKKNIGNIYYKFLKNNNKIYIPPPKKENFENIYWVVGIVLNKNSRINAKIFARKLLRRNIETRPFFYPMNKQKILKELKLVKKNEKFPNSEYISEYGLYLPSGINLKYNEIKYICDEVNNILS